MEMGFGNAPPEHLYTNQTHPYCRAPHLYVATAARFMPGRQVLTPEQARATPHALVGDVSEICDQLVERRERWGISYLGLSQDQLEPFAPVVARLAGT